MGFVRERMSRADKEWAYSLNIDNPWSGYCGGLFGYNRDVRANPGARGRSESA
jgi:hypothetical protein